MKLHILTITWNGAKRLKDLHPTLINSLTGIDYTWYIRDNASTDNTEEVVKSFDGNIAYFKYSTNTESFSQGNNFLFKQSNAGPDDYVLLLNDDIIFNDTKSLKAMISVLDKDQGVGVVGTKLKYIGTDLIQHAGVVFHKSLRTPMHLRANEKDDKLSSIDRLFQAVTGACLLTRASIYSELNGLDENYKWAFEDIHFCLKVHYDLKKKVVYCGQTNISHEESATLKKHPVNKLMMPTNVKYYMSNWRDRVILDQDHYKEKRHNVYQAK